MTKPRSLTPKLVSSWLPERPSESNKGSFGHVLIVAGSRDMAGAAGLSGLGALRSGAGLVSVAVPEGRQSAVACIIPEALTTGLPEKAGHLSLASARVVAKLLSGKKFAAFALGPGLTTAPEAVRAVVALIRLSAGLPAVIDADALNALSSLPKDQAAALLKARSIPAVLTPHPGELARLLHTTLAQIQKDRARAAREAARRFGAVCLLKGSRTVISDGKKIFVNTTGNAGMARGGMGDVLTGLIGGFLAQFAAAGRRDAEAALEAACLGAYAHGLAGDIAARELGKVAMLARDLAAALPRALRRIELGH